MKHMLAFAFLLSALLTATMWPIASHAALTSDSPKGHATLQVGKDAQKGDAALWAVIHFTLEDEWHIYWQNPGDSGLEPTVQWTLPDGMKAGPIHWPTPKRIEYSGLYNYGYGKDVTFLVPLESASVFEQPIHVHARLNWLICKDVCIPESAELDADFDPHQIDPELSTTIQKTLLHIPTPLKDAGHYAIDGGKVTIDIPLPTEAKIAAAWWYPAEDGTISNASDQTWTQDQDGLHLSIDKGTGNPASPFHGHLSIRYTDDNTAEWFAEANAASGAAPVSAKSEPEPANVHSPSPAQDASPPLTLLGALVAAFLGGLILNIMPCVLPILSLKALSIAKKSQHNLAHVRWMGIAYSAGVLCCFGAIAGTLIILQQAGQSIGWGFQLQSPEFVLVLLYVMFLIGLNLSGLFQLPTLFGSAGQSLTSNDRGSGSFFTGALAALVATPCTAPFMATAIGFALSQPPLFSMLIFLSLGAGLAFPYLLISFVPALHRLLPKPGAWMERFKQFLAFPMYATAAWLLWVLVQQSGPAGLAQALFGVCLLAFGVWAIPLFSRNRFLQIALLMLLGGLILRTIEHQQAIDESSTQAEQTDNQHYSEEKLQRLLDQKKPVFVYATAAWCITCKVNERAAIETDAVKNAMKRLGITTLVADWTHRDATITKFLAKFGRNGVPLYVYFAPDAPPVVLPQLLTPDIMLGYLDPAS